MRESELTARLGAPVSRRAAGGDVWLVYASGELSLRVRCAPPAGGREPIVASWTATFDPGYERLSEAARAVGLWPVAAPDESASDARVPLFRRPIPCPASGSVCSLTATVRSGRVTQISVFDEEPDWL